MTKSIICFGLFLVLGNAVNICHAEDKDVIIEDLIEEENGNVEVQTEEENKCKITGCVIGEAGCLVHLNDKFQLNNKNVQEKGLTFYNAEAKLGVEKSFLLYGANLKCVIEGKWDPSAVKLSKAYSEMDHLVLGYTASNLVYENGNNYLPIAASQKVFQLKWKDKIGDHFGYGFALESGSDFKIGNMSKSKKQQEVSSVYKNDDKDVKFKSKNDFPTGSINIEGKWEKRVDFFVSGLFRFLNYCDTQQEERQYMVTGGGNGGTTIHFIPDKTKLVIQGCYSYGMGQYISGLAAFEKEKETPQAVAVYYHDDCNDKQQLHCIGAWGVGITFSQSLTEKLETYIAGSWLTTDNKSVGRHDMDFWRSLFMSSGVSYEFNKHLTVIGSGILETKWIIKNEISQTLTLGIGMECKL